MPRAGATDDRPGAARRALRRAGGTPGSARV